MATVEIELRNYKRGNGLQPLVLRVTAGKVVSRKNTGLYIKESEWDANKRRVNRKHPHWARLNDALDVLVKEAESFKADAIRDRQPVNPAEVNAKVFATTDFYEAVDKKIASFSEDQGNSADKYRKMVRHLKNFAPTLLVEEITPAFLSKFKIYLETKGKEVKDQAGTKRVGLAHNTIVTTLSCVRAVINTLDLKGANPFDKSTVGTWRKGKSEGLDIDDIRRLRTYIPSGRWDSLAKDTFLFSFYAAGMRSGDVLDLAWSEIKKDRIIYDQGKKKNAEDEDISVPLNDVTREILSRYDRSTPTVFNLTKTPGGGRLAVNERKQIQAEINRFLKIIAQRVGITKSIQFKLARKSFATIANEMSQYAKVYSIQQAMGHSKISTTEIYLGNDNKAIDELCRVVYG